MFVDPGICLSTVMWLIFIHLFVGNMVLTHVLCCFGINDVKCATISTVIFCIACNEFAVHYISLCIMLCFCIFKITKSLLFIFIGKHTRSEGKDP